MPVRGGRLLAVLAAARIAASLSFSVSVIRVDMSLGGHGSGFAVSRSAGSRIPAARALGPSLRAGDKGAGEPRPHTLADTGRAGRELDGLRRATKVANAGRRTAEFTTDPLGRSVVNVPVFRASTVTFPNTTSLRSRPRGTSDVWEGLFYGRFGSLTHRALEDAFATLEVCVWGRGEGRACLTTSALWPCLCLPGTAVAEQITNARVRMCVFARVRTRTRSTCLDGCAGVFMRMF